MVLLGLDLAAGLACGESPVLHAILKLDTLGICPGDVITEALPVTLEVCLNIVRQRGLLDLCLDGGVNAAPDSVSGLLPLGAIVVIECEHVVVRPAIHLDWEDCGLERKCLEAHLVDPGLEVEAVNWWDRVVLLTSLYLVVVLPRRVETQEHGLSAQDGGVVPRGLDIDLCDIVKLIHESVGACRSLLLLDVPVAQLVADHVLLPDAERGDVVRVLGLLVFGGGEVQQLRGSMGALSADLVNVFDVLACPAHLCRCVDGLSLGSG